MIEISRRCFKAIAIIIDEIRFGYPVDVGHSICIHHICVRTKKGERFQKINAQFIHLIFGRIVSMNYSKAIEISLVFAHALHSICHNFQFGKRTIIEKKIHLIHLQSDLRPERCRDKNLVRETNWMDFAFTELHAIWEFFMVSSFKGILWVPSSVFFLLRKKIVEQ